MEGEVVQHLLCLWLTRCRRTVLSQAVAQRCHPSQVMRSRSYYSFFFLDLLVFIEIARKSAIFIIPLWSLQICFLPARHNHVRSEMHFTQHWNAFHDHLENSGCFAKNVAKYSHMATVMMVSPWPTDRAWIVDQRASQVCHQACNDRWRTAKTTRCLGFHPSFDGSVCSDFKK